MKVSRAEEVGREIIGRCGGAFISRRDGYVLIKVPMNGETVIIWIRQSPIDRGAIDYVQRVIRRHEYDKLILLKLYQEADYVAFDGLRSFDSVWVGNPEIPPETREKTEKIEVGEK